MAFTKTGYSMTTIEITPEPGADSITANDIYKALGAVSSGAKFVGGHENDAGRELTLSFKVAE